jgi:2-haloacid dehalogenase
MERFLAEVCTSDWNLQQDAGRSWAEAVTLLKGKHPDQARLIDAFHQRWPEMLAGPIEGTVAILRELRDIGTPLYALTNWSHETFPIALERFEFLDWFRGIIVSGQEKLVKPDPRIYQLLMERHGLQPEDIAYVDDNLRNAEAATALGMHGIHFISPTALRNELTLLGLLREKP